MFRNKFNEYNELNTHIDKILNRVDGIHKFYIGIITALIGIITAVLACKLDSYTLYMIIKYVLLLFVATCILWYKHLFTSYLDLFYLTDKYNNFTEQHKYIPIYQLNKVTNNLRVNSYLPKSIALIITVFLCRYYSRPDCIFSIKPLWDMLLQICLYCTLYIEGFYSPIMKLINCIKNKLKR